MKAEISKNAMTVLEKRYLLRNAQGKLSETPDQLFLRVADAVAQAELPYGGANSFEHWREQFYTLLSSLDFLPNSPTLMNAGTKLGQLSACFVLPLEDTMSSIFETLRITALIQQSGGGTGFNFSKLRPKDAPINGSGRSTGAVSFMQVFDEATEHIKQGGKRRGANMGILNIDHPDILEFLEAKKTPGVLSNFNISAGITDAFMHAVENDATWQLQHPSLKEPIEIRARELWNKIVQSAWETGDPGMIFLDEINRHNPTPKVGRIEATNPCGEVPLLPYEACNLGSINLLHMLKSDGDHSVIDWERLKTTTQTAIRFLDNVIEVNDYVTPEIRDMVLGNRKIGLGVMGWAEMLIRLEIPYDSDDAVQLGEQLMAFINTTSREESERLAEERGPFPNWEKSIYFPGTQLRNATRTSIAPTGTISIIAGTSSSIEPLFALAFERQHVLDGEVLSEINPLLADYLKRYAPDNLNNELPVGELLGLLPEKIQKCFRTSMEISWRNHIRHQIAFQKHTDNGVSKTINLPNHATRQDIEDAYLLAYKTGCLGITV